MIRNLAERNVHSYEWIDILAPDLNDLHEVADRYGLHEASVTDSLQPDHLPKYERIKNYTFIILRVFGSENDVEADTVQEVTNKIAVFISEKFIITIHRYEWQPLERISQNFVDTGECREPFHVLVEIVRAALLSYELPGRKLTSSIDYYEEQVFLKQRKAPLLKGLYFLKRKIDVIRRILLLTYEIIDRIDPPEKSNTYTRDVRDLYIKQQSIFDSLFENTNHLLAIYFNVSAQRTNEIIRILTIFSVFFMPLTFIVGIYGMNFDFMPELKWRWGYPGVMILMAVIVLVIYIWFKRKKWL